jgi:hypothetical protein
MDRSCAEPWATVRDDFPEIAEAGIPAMAFDQLGEAQSPAALAPGTGYLQHPRLGRDLAQGGRAFAAHRL